ncbi:MAG: acyl-CoA thioesterase [Nannocystales bacterium]
MLRYSARLIPVVLRAGLSRKDTLVSRLHRRVHLSECDFNLHMNQASYPTVAEYGRTDWMFRSGLISRLWKSRCKPVVAEQRLVYRRELKPGQRYVIDTRATGFDGRLLQVDSVLRVGDRVHTLVHAKLITIGPRGVLTTEETHELTSCVVTDALPIADWRVTES